MITCANKAHGLGRRGGHEPLPEAGEYVCDCYEHGTGEPWAHVGSSHVHERIVRCADCAKGYEFSAHGSCYLVCKRLDGYHHIVEQNGFCAWGERRAQ